jgi:hypothetical protein
MVSYSHHPGTPVVPALQPGCGFRHAEKKHPGGYQPVCDRPEPARSGMMQLRYPMPVKISGENKQRQYDIFKLLYLRKIICYGIKSAIEAVYRSGFASKSFVIQFVIEIIMMSRSAQQLVSVE